MFECFDAPGNTGIHFQTDPVRILESALHNAPFLIAEFSPLSVLASAQAMAVGKGGGDQRLRQS
ncbi:MAG: hypothetical protein DME26_09530 [Verrucomicrobia bacterium]|nr:MAG: hypothetical protein DME26_09530 [Verrucomicrobiota bacterium]